MFLKNKNIIFKIRRSKVTDYAALTNSADPDEMQYNAAFHLGLHCLPKYPFRGFRYTKRVKLPCRTRDVYFHLELHLHS